MSAPKASAPKAPSGTKPSSGAKVRPLGYADSPLATSIGGKLLGFYLLISAIFAFLVIGFSFYDQTSGIEQRARFLGEANLHIISEALWTFDDVQRDSVAAVLLHSEDLSGVAFRYLDADKKLVSASRGKTLELPVNKALSPDVQTNINVFEKTGWMRLPVFYQDERQPKVQIGELTLFTNNQLALSRHALKTVGTIFIAVLGVLLNWVVLRAVLTRHLAEPMRLIIVKLLQVQKIIPETEVDPTMFRKLKIERFGNEFRLLEKQLEKIIMTNFELAEAAAHAAAQPVRAPAEDGDSSETDSSGDATPDASNESDDGGQQVTATDSDSSAEEAAQPTDTTEESRGENKPA